MTTFGLAIFFFAVLMIYCGVKGTSLTQALLGHAVPSTSGSLIPASSGSTGTASAPGTSTATAGAGLSTSGSQIAPNTGG